MAACLVQLHAVLQHRPCRIPRFYQPRRALFYDAGDRKGEAGAAALMVTHLFWKLLEDLCFLQLQSQEVMRSIAFKGLAPSIGCSGKLLARSSADVLHSCELSLI